MSIAHHTESFYHALYDAASAAVTRYPAEKAVIRRAVDLVERGHVEPSQYRDGEYLVQSACDEGTAYHVNGACTCPAAARATEGRCKHRWAVALWKRVTKALLDDPWNTVHSVELRDQMAATGNLVATVCTPEWRMRNNGQHEITAGK